MVKLDHTADLCLVFLRKLLSDSHGACTSSRSHHTFSFLPTSSPALAVVFDDSQADWGDTESRSVLLQFAFP